MIFFRLSFPVLLLVQNTQKIIAKGKAQIGVSILQFPVIKGGMFRKADRKYQTVRLCFGRCFLALHFCDDDLQVVIGRIFTELFFKIRPAHFFSKQGKFRILKGYSSFIKGRYFIFICSQIHRISLMIEVADRVKLQKFLGKAPCIAPAVNADGLPLHFRQKIKHLLDSGRLWKELLHLFGRNIGKIGKIQFFKQILFVMIQITDKSPYPSVPPRTIVQIGV